MILIRLTLSRGYARSVGRKLIFGTLCVTNGNVATATGWVETLNNRRRRVSEEVNEVIDVVADKVTMIFKSLDEELAELGGHFTKRGLNPYTASIVMARAIAVGLAATAEISESEEPTDEVSEDA